LHDIEWCANNLFILAKDEGLWDRHYFVGRKGRAARIMSVESPEHGIFLARFDEQLGIIVGLLVFYAEHNAVVYTDTG